MTLGFVRELTYFECILDLEEAHSAGILWYLKNVKYNFVKNAKNNKHKWILIAWAKALFACVFLFVDLLWCSFVGFPVNRLNKCP